MAVKATMGNVFFIMTSLLANAWIQSRAATCLPNRPGIHRVNRESVEVTRVPGRERGVPRRYNAGNFDVAVINGLPRMLARRRSRSSFTRSVDVERQDTTLKVV